MHKLHIDLKQMRDDSYDIIIGEGLLDNASEYIKPLLGNNQVIIVGDQITIDFFIDRLKNNLSAAGIVCSKIIIKGGEKAKSIKEYEKLITGLFASDAERQTTLIALGGGVVGDLCGFVAATFMRGIPFIQIPTTLLAQVDSAVGGKTGINYGVNKNMIGAFHQPRLVLADTSLLRTLPERQLRAGYAEIVKYALINDPDFFDWLDEHGESIVTSPPNKEALVYAIEKSCTHKAAIVAKDEKESGMRALLNLGHTFGHALEALRKDKDDEKLLHGEAVAIGLELAFLVSHRMELCKTDDLERVQAHLQKMGLRKNPDEILPHISRKELGNKLLSKMTYDKKGHGNNMRFILVRGIGKAFIHDFDFGEISPVMDAIRDYFKI